MPLFEGQLYHIYNQGNNKEGVFRSRENYLYFLKKVRSLIYPMCEILAYCLMPNHFHFLIETTEESCEEVKVDSLKTTSLANGFRSLLSGYTKGYNKENDRSGSLFRQRTKYKLLEKQDECYPFICFNYIHQNPFKATLVKRIDEWEFSSFRDYVGLRNGTLCNKERAVELLGIDLQTYHQLVYDVIPDHAIRLIH